MRRSRAPSRRPLEPARRLCGALPLPATSRRPRECPPALDGQPFTFDDLIPERLPALVETDVPQAGYVDAVTARGLASLDLPATYPLDGVGREVGHKRCQAIGSAACAPVARHRLPGRRTRRAGPTARSLPSFDRGLRLRRGRRQRFERCIAGR